MPKDKNANNKFKTLDKLAKRELNELGANNVSVPKIIRIINVILLIGAIILVIYHITKL